MSTRRECAGRAARILAALRPHVERHALPGAVFRVEGPGEGATSGAIGLHAVEPSPEAAHEDALYDLASLTKPLVTAPLAILLARHGQIDLEAPLGSFLPEFRSGPRERATLLDCLCHVAGFPAWLPLTAILDDPAALGPFLGSLAGGGAPRERVEYSDLGFLAIQMAIERSAGLTLDQIFEREIRGPLGLADLLFRPPEPRRCAPTEARGNEFERERAALSHGPAGAARFRTRPIRGEVNDGNTWHLGGVSGAAGLFGTAEAVVTLCREFLGGDAPACAASGARGLFRPGEIRLLSTCQTAGLDGDRTAGFECATHPGSSAGSALSPLAFGHTGFTGTSAWIDPETRSIYVLLSNRIHPSVTAEPFHPVRREFHAAAAGL